MVSTQLAKQLVASDSSKVDHASAFIGTKSGLDQAELGDSGRAWAAFEKLRGQNPGTGDAALKDLSVLLTQVQHPDVLEAVIDALRSQEPIHFSFDEVRESVFKSLAPFISDVRVQSVLVEELELRSQFKKSAKVVVEHLNAIPKITDQGIADRLAELFVLNRGNGEDPEFLKTLTPHFGVTPDQKLLVKGQELAESYYRSGNSPPPPGVLGFLALSSDSASISLVCKIAKQDFREKFKFWEGVSDAIETTEPFGALFAGTLVVGAFVSIIVGLATKSFIPLGISAAVAGIEMVIGSLISDTNNRDYRKIHNSQAALEACEALTWAWHDKSARQTLLDLSMAEDGDRKLRTLATECYREGRAKFT